ncbi:MAG: hypothetical protein HOI15_02690, partial [Opitutales bacterium]|nr:hypothetical protein [Opitutales bacterium]
YRTVYRHGSYAGGFFGIHHIENIICADRLVAGPNEFEDLAAKFGKPRTPLATNPHRNGYSLFHALIMIVSGLWKCGFNQSQSTPLEP